MIEKNEGNGRNKRIKKNVWDERDDYNNWEE